MTLVNDEKSLSGTVSYKYMMLILRTYNGASRRFNLPSSSDILAFLGILLFLQEPPVKTGRLLLHTEEQEV